MPTYEHSVSKGFWRAILQIPVQKGRSSPWTTVSHMPVCKRHYKTPRNIGCQCLVPAAGSYTVELTGRVLNLRSESNTLQHLTTDLQLGMHQTSFEDYGQIGLPNRIPVQLFGRSPIVVIESYVIRKCRCRIWFCWLHTSRYGNTSYFTYHIGIKPTFKSQAAQSDQTALFSIFTRTLLRYVQVFTIVNPSRSVAILWPLCKILRNCPREPLRRRGGELNARGVSI